MPTAVRLSQCIGVGGCACTNSSNMVQIILPSFVLRNKAPSSASAAGERTKCIHWGKFQHTFSECLAFLLVVKNEGSYAYGGTRDVLLGDADGQNAW